MTKFNTRHLLKLSTVGDKYVYHSVAYPGIFFGGGSTNSVEDRGQRTADLGAVAP
jgi:hypothetical protein